MIGNKAQQPYVRQACVRLVRSNYRRPLLFLSNYLWRIHEGSCWSKACRRRLRACSR